MEYKVLEKKRAEYMRQKISINMERGWPCEEQLQLSLPMLDLVSSKTELVREIDYRGYAGTGGIRPLKELFAQILDVSVDEIYIGGTMSTTIMYDVINKFYVMGVNGNSPWCKQEKVKFICPSPGYEKHFKICKAFGIEMIAVPIRKDGPDMEIVESLVSQDQSIKGIWCVPLYSNPTGEIYSDEVVGRIAGMHTAAADFVVMWDNAYCVHHLTEKRNSIRNIIRECEKARNPDRVFEFTSTSKITFPGGGVGVCASSKENIQWLTENSLLQLKSGDKINQLRHYLFLQDMEHLQMHMEKHAAIIRPKFDLVDTILHEELDKFQIAKWKKPEGGYFMHLELLPNMAKEVWKTCMEMGVRITPAGSTYPYGIEEKDYTLRLAPTYLNENQLMTAMKVLCLAIKYVYMKIYGNLI